MKKLLLLFFIVFPFYLYSQVVWYGSASSGQVIKAISDFERDEYDYVLSIEQKEDTEERILYKGDEKIKRWLIYYENGQIKQVSLFLPPDVIYSDTYYSEAGRLLKEVFYKKDGSVDYTWDYVYRGAVLVSKTRNYVDGDSDDYSLLYKYNKSGRLSAVLNDADDSEDRYVQINGRLVEEWHGNKGTGFLIRYLKDGRKLEKEEWRDGSIYSVLSYYYKDNKIEKSIKTWPNEDRREETLFDEEKPVLSVVYENQFPVKKTEFKYSNDRLTEKIQIEPGKIIVFKYKYDGDELEEESIAENYKITVIRKYKDGLLYTERILLEDGAILMREYNSDGEIVKEYIKAE